MLRIFVFKICTIYVRLIYFSFKFQSYSCINKE